jgi:myosin heavy subunit
VSPGKPSSIIRFLDLFTGMDRFWIPHKELAYVNCHMLNSTDKGVMYMSEHGEQIEVAQKDVEALQRVSDDQLSGIDNVCNLSDVNEAAVLNTCRVRYMRKEIYTRVARIVIAVNPFQTLNIYSSTFLDKYGKAADSMDLDPHVYGVGLDAVNGLRRSGANQAILISGESGAGKTETTKLVLSFVASTIPGVRGIEDKIQQTSPILEAFGNAMTVRNNNSSRFGKWLELAISRTFTILGCSITDYLLELTRVTGQGAGERGFHVFFHILASRDQEEVNGLDFGSPKDYRYFDGAEHKAPGIDDAECFAEMREAFNTLGMGDKQKEVYGIVIGLLTLGNTSFLEDGDASKLADESPVLKTAKLLQVDMDLLKNPLLTKRLVVGKEVTLAPLKAAGAKTARDALVRLIYSKLFKWLIKSINKTLVGDSAPQFFGVLDVAGFESFAINSMEQLLINLGNEYLQGHFNNHVFKMELEDYKNEGVSVSAVIEFKDNDDIIQLLTGGKEGILPLLDNEISVPRATDQTFVNKATKQHDGHPRFVKNKFGKCMFSVNHFAGVVEYTCDGFLDKNTDNPPKEACDLLCASANSVLKEMGEALKLEQEEADKSRAKKTVSKHFRTSLDELMSKLRSAEPHFIRCIKPNVEKVPDKFSAPLVKEQLVLSGVMEAVRIRQQGYASRILHADFCFRYKCVLPKRVQREVFTPGWRDQTKAIAAKFVSLLPEALTVCGSVPANHFLVGNNKVLAKVTAMAVLDQAYDLAVSGYAVDIQRTWKGFKIRKMMKEVKVVVADLNAWLKKTNVYTAPGPENTAVAKLKTQEAIDGAVKELQIILEKGQTLPLPLPNVDTLKKNVKKMENESKWLAQMSAIERTVEPIEIDKVVARAKDLGMPEAMTEALSARRALLKAQIPVKLAMVSALEQKDKEQLQQAWDEAVNQQLEGDAKVAGKWIPELEAESVAVDVRKMLDEILKAEEEERQRQTEEERKKKEDEERKRREAEAQAAKDAEAAGGRKKTITGLTMEDQQRVLLGINAAIHEFDTFLLEQRLTEATRQGMEPEDLEQGQDFLNQLNSEDFLKQQIVAHTEKVSGSSPDSHDLKALQNLIKQAKSLQVCDDEIQKAQEAQQAGMRRRASHIAPGANVFAAGAAGEEVELARGVFDNLFDFKHLKSPLQWKGHKSEFLLHFGRGARGEEVMLCHNKSEINDPLTKIPTSSDVAAQKNFKNILGWMHDKPVQEVTRLGYAQDIVDFAMKDSALGDEVYVQVMKQLTKNPSKRSLLLGWKLMLSLCQQVCPTSDLMDFVRAFISRNIESNSDNDEIKELCKHCLDDLNQLAQPDEEEEEDSVAIQVQLIDNSARKLIVKRSTTLDKLGEKMGETLKIFKHSDFSFFQLTEGLETHRLLPSHTVLAKLLDKWEQLKSQTGRTSKLLWKRRFMRVDEKLQAGDLMHATLTYRQALWDFYRYPIAEDYEFLCKIAGTILCVERDHYASYIRDKKLGDVGILEQLLPDYTLKQGVKRTKWATDVLTKYHALEGRLDPQETRLQKMSRIVSLVQKMKLFGAYYWLGRQVYSVAPEKVSIPDAPEENCKINPKQQEDEYWVVVDVFGVRFVTPTTQSGKQFQRGFLYHDEAMERIIRWGAKQNVVEFVVQTVNPANPKAGRVPMAIRIASTGAVDVAYCIHCIQNERKGIKW